MIISSRCRCWRYLQDSYLSSVSVSFFANSFLFSFIKPYLIFVDRCYLCNGKLIISTKTKACRKGTHIGFSDSDKQAASVKSTDHVVMFCLPVKSTKGQGCLGLCNDRNRQIKKRENLLSNLTLQEKLDAHPANRTYGYHQSLSYA